MPRKTPASTATPWSRSRGATRRSPPTTARRSRGSGLTNPFDQARARQLLAEAGFTPGPDGFLGDSTGRRLEITIMSTAGNALREQIEQVIKEQLTQVGMDLRIDNRPASVFLGPVINRRQFPHLALYGSLFSPETLPISRFHSSKIPSAANNWEGDNRAGWRNAENDRLWEQMISELDEKKRMALFRRQQEILPRICRASRSTSASAGRPRTRRSPTSGPPAWRARTCCGTATTGGGTTEPEALRFEPHGMAESAHARALAASHPSRRLGASTRRARILLPRC